MKRIILSVAVILSMGLAGCQTTGGNKQTMGTVGGGVIGGLLGSQVGGGSGSKWATGIGVLLGALAGAEIGASLDKADMMYAQQANTKAHTAPIGETISWNNPESGHGGSVTPVKDRYSNQTKKYCREYEQTIYIDGKAQTGFGTACQQNDGRWEFS